jgi:hypothetical protein
MAALILARARFEIAYWIVLWPGFTLCNTPGCYRAGVVWIRTVRPLANALSPDCI